MQCVGGREMSQLPCGHWTHRLPHRALQHANSTSKMRVSEVARLDSLLNGRDRGGWAGEAASTGPSVVSFAGLGGHYSRQDET